jgi:flagellar protein FlaG
MVGKLHEITASAIAEASKKAGGSAAPQLEIKKHQPSAVKVPTVKDIQAAKDEKKKEEEQKEGRLEPGTMSEESVNDMTDVLNELMDKTNVNIEFSYNKKVNMLNVKMIDKETKEVIKEFPPEEMIENMIKAKDWLGAFIDRAI